MKHLLCVVLWLPLFTAQADTFGFYPIHFATNEFAQSVGEQLSMEMAAPEPGSVSLTFLNTGSVVSEIREIYFYTSNDLDPAVNITLGSIVNSPDVKFNDGGSNGVNPKNLPAGSTLLQDYSLAAAVDSKKGIDPGEYLTLTLNYADPPYSFIDLLHSGQLRIGIHAAKIQGVSSVSFLNIIPEPASVLLVGITASSYVFLRRRLARTSA